MEQKNVYLSFFKCGLFHANKQRGHPLTSKRDRLFIMGLLILITNCLFLSACGDQVTVVEKTNEKVLSLLPQESNQSLDGSVKAELPLLDKFTEDIYLLEKLAKNPTHQVILFAPSDEALMPYLEKVHGVKKRKALLKNGIVLHSKLLGNWEGQATTYGGMAIRVSDDESKLIFNDQEARILKKIQSKDGHLVYIINQLIS